VPSLLPGLLARATSNACTAASMTLMPLIVHADLMVAANGFRESCPGRVTLLDCHIALRFAG